jgi:hypothetical protein
MDTGEVGRTQTPLEVPRSGLKIPTRGAATLPAPTAKTAAKTTASPQEAPEADPAPLGWAEEEQAPAPARNGFGPVGLVAAALLLMVAVYFGATLLMKQ